MKHRFRFLAIQGPGGIVSTRNIGSVSIHFSDSAYMISTLQYSLEDRAVCIGYLTIYISGAQLPARGPHPARDESSCGPRCPTIKVTILSPDINFSLQWHNLNFTKISCT